MVPCHGFVLSALGSLSKVLDTEVTQSHGCIEKITLAVGGVTVETVRPGRRPLQEPKREMKVACLVMVAVEREKNPIRDIGRGLR